MQKKYFILIAIAAAALGALFLVFKTNAPQVPSDQKQEEVQISPQNIIYTDSISPTPFSLSNEISLTVISPKDQTVVSVSTIKVSGKTKPNADVVVNDQELKADNNGNFTANITLDEGDNIIGIVVYDEDGNYAEEEIIVTYEPED